MTENRKYLVIILTTVLLAMTACSKSAEDANTQANDDSRDNHSAENSNGNASYDNSNDANEDENTQEDGSDNEPSENKSSNSNDGSKTSDTTENDANINNKKAYLDKLNEMEEADRTASGGDTMVELEKDEEERFQKWDDELNEIYGMLKRQLDTNQMQPLKEEQRDWVKSRDEKAKEASLKYEGGSTETLEYLATQASLTRERCYELVAGYME